MFKIKEVAIRRDDEGAGWQTVITVISQFSAVEPQVITIVVPPSEVAPSYEQAVSSAKAYVRKLLADEGARPNKEKSADSAKQVPDAHLQTVPGGIHYGTDRRSHRNSIRA